MSNSPQFKSYPKGKLSFISIKAEKTKKGPFPLFDYHNKTNINSENVGKEFFKSQDYNAKFSENDIWNSFFYHLIYINIHKLYDLGEITTANIDQFDDEYYKENKIAINKILNSLKDIDIKEYIKTNYKNGLESLTERIVDYRYKVLIAAEHLENNQILIVMEHLVKDYIHNCKGFPDLMVWNCNEIFFAEIKACTDFLNRRQVKLIKHYKKQE